MATRITGSQRAARKRNIKIAQKAKKKGGKVTSVRSRITGKMLKVSKPARSSTGKKMKKMSARAHKQIKLGMEAKAPRRSVLPLSITSSKHRAGVKLVKAVRAHNRRGRTHLY